jgi:hypothetical protein
LELTTIPVVPGTGIGDPAGSTNTCHCVAVAASVHPNNAEVDVTCDTVKPDGLGQVGGGEHVTLATQPAAVTELSEVKTKVRHPVVEEDVNAAGIAVPVSVANKGDAAVGPS